MKKAILIVSFGTTYPGTRQKNITAIREQVQAGNLTPVFFGSALTNFGVEIFLKYFLEMTTTPLPRKADIGIIDPVENEFSAFVFKIQANMNKAHRDRVAFMRICSGKFDASMEVKHVQGGKVMRLSQPQQIMADERKILSEAYAGDIIRICSVFQLQVPDASYKAESGLSYSSASVCVPVFPGLPSQELYFLPIHVPDHIPVP